MLSKIVMPPVLGDIILFIAIFFSATLFFTPLHAETSHSEIQDPYYIGFGTGASFLRPKTDSTSLALSYNDDIAYKYFAGYQYDAHWFAELFWANLGDSKIRSRTTSSIVGLTEYMAYGVGGLYRFPVNASWNAFATAGVGMLNNNFQYTDLESTDNHFFYAGLGVLWNLADTLDLRAEYDFYNSNAQMLSINIVKRFGFSSQNNHSTKPVNKPEAVATVIKKKNCEDFHMDFKGVTFLQGSSELSKQYQLTLDNLALQMSKLPADIRFEIRAHTDDVGTELFNYQLSLTRAHVVRDYLSTKGIALSRIDAFGYGEWRMEDDNSSRAGRAQKRRAELVLVGVEKYVEVANDCTELVNMVFKASE